MTASSQSPALSALAPDTGRGRLSPWWPAFAAIAVFWLLVLNQQRLEWTVNPVYSYGWAVPFLVLYLFWARWSDRPAPGRPLVSAAFAAGMIFLFAAYLPVRVVQEANPDWVKVNWLMAALCAGSVMLILARVGGAPYMRHFLFPIAFSFTALPWPVWVQDTVAKSLMHFNAGFAAETLTLMGTPAMAEGNLIQVGGHWVNVEEACSGIRSLQAAFMIALFLGEFNRLPAWRRVLLLAASFAVAFAVNLGRTLILTRLANDGAADRWHDTIGMISLAVCLVLLWILAELIRPRVAAPAGGGTARAPFLAPPFGWRAAGLAGLWLVAAEGLTWGWYHVHERMLPPPVVWDVAWPRSAPAFAEGQFDERMRALLKYNRGATASWETTDGYQWQIYYLQWLPGRVSKFLSSAHYPTVCLPATGLSLEAETGVWHCRADGIDFPFTTYVFSEAGREVYVFHAVMEDRPVSGNHAADYRQVSSSERLGSVWRGERNLGQRVIGIALRGPVSPAEARTVVAGTLAAVVETGRSNPNLRTASLP